MSDESGMTRRERRAAARYLWEFSAGMVLFLVLFLLLPGWWQTETGTWPHLIRTLLPMLPLIWGMAAIWRHVRNVDEMQRAVLLRSFAFGFAVAMLAALVVALLQGGGVVVPGSEWIIFIAGMTSWGVALPVNTAKSSR